MNIPNTNPVNESGGTAMPEWLARRDMKTGAWTVEQGLPLRGQAYTDLANRKMVVPFGSDDTARVIRAHEMMHAKVSPGPITKEQLQSLDVNISPETVVSAEEMRVNHLAMSAGFDMNLLSDGSEKTAGKRIAAMGLAAGWDRAVLFMAATFGTKSCADFVAGVKSVDTDFGSLLVKARSRINKKHKHLARIYKHLIGSTEAHISELPKGFILYSIPMAELLEQLLLGVRDDADQPNEADQQIANKVSGRATWARMVLDTDVLLNKHVNGRIGRKRIASVTGRTPRHLDRLLTDPDRRIFERRSRGKGGVVLIDQSGSMHLETSHIDQLIAAAPGCVIIGYSHATGDTSGTPNVWMIANRGKVVESVREGNGGNGVDGPALRFALTHRRTGEPFVWVCDGMVTDGEQDNAHEHLNEECAELVVKHRIHMAYDLDEAIAALRHAASAPLKMRLVGSLAHTRAAAIAAFAS